MIVAKSGPAIVCLHCRQNTTQQNHKCNCNLLSSVYGFKRAVLSGIGLLEKSNFVKCQTDLIETFGAKPTYVR